MSPHDLLTTAGAVFSLLVSLIVALISSQAKTLVNHLEYQINELQKHISKLETELSQTRTQQQTFAITSASVTERIAVYMEQINDLRHDLGDVRKNADYQSAQIAEMAGELKRIVKSIPPPPARESSHAIPIPSRYSKVDR